MNGLYIQWNLHVGDSILILTVLSLVEKLSSFGGSKCIKTFLGPRPVSSVERTIILCPSPTLEVSLYTICIIYNNPWGVEETDIIIIIG